MRVLAKRALDAGRSLVGAQERDMEASAWDRARESRRVDITNETEWQSLQPLHKGLTYNSVNTDTTH